MATEAADAIGAGPTALSPESAAAIAAGDEPLAAGTAAGDYVIERRIGAGGMGEVYAGRHPAIGKRVAIKVLRPALAARADSAERFLREARAVNQVDHPNVVDVFAVGRLADGRLYLVMDLLDGATLRERLRAGPVPGPIAIEILRQVAGALDAAHARGVVHRDLKPDNVVLTGPADRPTAHVLDFGIAKLLADASGDAVATLTGQGTWMGTPAYMAPEQWTADGATGASDRYALGVVAYELCTGKAPFHAPSLPAMMEQHFRAAVPSVTTATGRALPIGLDAVFARALAKEPGARPASAAALVDELEAALAGQVVARRSRSLTAEHDAWRARPWVAVAGGAVVIAAGAVLLTGALRGKPRDRQAGAGPAVPTAPARGTVTIVSTPAGAVVTRAGARIGETPMTITAAPGEAIDVELSLPGYVAVVRSVVVDADRPAELRAELALAQGFDGVWALPEGELRAFERRGDQVAGWRLPTPNGAREFLRFFAFVPAGRGAVAFTATEPFVVEAAPDEPSCNIPLRAEYVYRPAADVLELRKERAQYTVTDGRCTLHATAWSEPRTLTRVAGAPVATDWAESRAGAAALVPPGQPPTDVVPLNAPPVNAAADQPPVSARNDQKPVNASPDRKPVNAKPTKPSRRKPAPKPVLGDGAPDAVSPGAANGTGNANDGPQANAPGNDDNQAVQAPIPNGNDREQRGAPPQPAPPIAQPPAANKNPVRDIDNVQSDGSQAPRPPPPMQGAVPQAK